MKTIFPRIALLLLCLGLSVPGLHAQFRISGNVSFGKDLEPVPDYEVSVYLPVHQQQYTVLTNGDGDYEAIFDWTSAEILEAQVEVVDLCTGEVKAVRLPNADSTYVANFRLCEGIDPPPPPPGCESHFTYEQLSVNPPTVLFLDLSYHSDPEIAYLWEFGDGKTSTESSPVHEFPATGVYEVKLSVRTDSCTSSSVQTVLVKDTLDCVCPAVYNPVCVTLDDGLVISFTNRCEAECAGFSVDEWTSCEPNECGCPEFYDPVCVFSPNGDTLTFSNHCFAECAGYAPDQFVSCNPINECECAPVDEPVCVLNDAGEVLRFPNACLAQCAGYPASSFVDCNTGCICPEYYDPVCVVAGSDTLSFPNICFAQCEGYWPDEVFSCDPDEGCVCPQVYDPVCVIGANGDSLQFSNACLAECAGYAEDQIFPCEPEPCACPEYYDPVCVVVNGDTLSFPNICFAECEGYGPDQVFHCNPDGGCDCPDDYDPICVVADDGSVITFQNPCIAICRGYEEEAFINCDDNCICPAIYDPVCVITPNGEQIRFSNACEAECAGFTEDQLVECEPDPCVCPEYYDPVCVVENGVTRTFDNECFARCAGYTENDFFKCEPKECNCPEIYSPVCIVTDFGPAYWFVNACEAECAGFGPDQYENCSPVDCVCPAVIDPVCVISPEGDTLRFDNLCLAICAGLSEEEVVKCDIPNPCDCDMVYDPVCIYTPGGGVLRFANECEARCAGYDENVWVKCDDTYCQASFFIEHPNTGELGVQFVNRSYSVDSLEVKWHWDFGDGNVSEAFAPYHKYEKAGVYTVTMTMSSGNCTSSHRKQVVVGLDEPVEDCKAMFHFEQSADDPFHFQFHDRSLGDIVSWNWYFGDGTTSNEPTPDHQYTQAGIYIVSLSVTASDGCTSLVSMLVATDENIVYNPECYASFLPVFVPDSNQVYFLNFSSQDVVETHWDFGDGTSSDQLMPIHVFPGSGSYTVTLTVVTEAGCTNAYSATINLAGESFTANPAYSFRTTTDVDEPQAAPIRVKVFPNPVSTELWVDLKQPSSGNLQWRILNLNGQLVQQGQRAMSGTEDRFSIQTIDLPTGVYALQLISEAGMVTKKFVKDGSR